MKPNKCLLTVLSTALIATTVVACQLPTLFRTPTPTPTSTPPPPPVPPQVIQTVPEPGQEQPLDGPLQLVFDQPMDPPSVESAFAIEPRVSGTFEWPSPRVVRFKPAGIGFKRAARYTVTVEEGARSAEGLALKEPVQFHFTTVGFLEVTAVQPAPDTTEVATESGITVLFNRPVVPLVAVEDQANLPQPLTFVPPVVGQGEWLNTSIYLFTPGEGFAPATTYRARVAAGLTDTTGGVLADDFTWEFTTIMPAVAATYPGPGTVYVSPEPTIYVAFNQPMDHASAEAAFTLKDPSTGQAMAGTFEWHDEGLILPEGKTSYYEPYQWSWGAGKGPQRVGVETMGFTPAQPLDFATTYLAEVAAGARGAAGGQTGAPAPYRWPFTTIERPFIVGTSPADGEQRADPWGALNLSFSSPMDPESINTNFTVSPPVSPTDVYTYWWDSNTQLEISFPIEPNSDYAVTISGDVEGRYGHRLGQDTTIRWRTRALEPQAYLMSPGNVATYNAYTDTLAYVNVRNVRRVNFALYRMPLRDFMLANGRDSWEYWSDYAGREDNLVRQWTLDTEPPLNQSRIYRANLAGDAGGALAPGLYYLQVWADADAIYPEALPVSSPPWVNRQMLVVSRYNLSLKTTAAEALVWATDLASGDVLPNLLAAVMDEDANVLARGTTDRDGVFMAEYQLAGVPAMDWWTPVFAFTGDPDTGGEDFAAAVNGWSDGISPWDFGVPVESYQNPYAAYFFTDRPIYRPGQTVYFKGVLRDDDDAHYSLPRGGAEVNVVVWDPQGTKVFEDDLPVSDLGTLDGQLDLGSEAALGLYPINATYDEQSFGTSFQVAEYRKPEFEVTVEADKPEYVQGDTINVTAQATYFFGGPAAGSQVRYSVLAADHFFDYQGQGWWDFGDYDYYWGGGEGYGEVIADGSGTTDAQGRFTFRLEADIAKYVASQRFTLEVTVTDVNNQEVANRTEAIVHKGLYYIGLRPERYVGTVGRENRVNIITVDWESAPAPDHELTVIFAEHNWYSVQKLAEDGSFYWESVVEDVPVYTTTVTTGGEGKATASFTPGEGGIYKVIATGLDQRENEVRSATYMWVSGSDYISWRQENNDRITLVADKRQYRVGDTATILIPHPYQGPVKALITIERGHIYRHWVQTLETNSEQIEIPITEDLIPNVFVSVVIAKGMDETTPLPDFKIGYVQLPIETAEKELHIALTPDRPPEEHYQPGDRVTYDVRVTDSRGKAVQAELALSLVDKAVLTLAEQPGGTIAGYFWRERGLGVNTAHGLTRSGNRVNEQVAAEVKGLGGGGGGEEFGPVRTRFPDLAYWNPTLRTDQDGRATVSVELPDNLTTWRMGARGVTAQTLVGQADVDVVSTKDLLVRPVAPRFFVVGDQAELAAVIHNNTDQPLEVEVAFEADGLQISKPVPSEAEGSVNQQISIPANDNVKVTWQVAVEDRAEAVLRFGARTVGQSVGLHHLSVPSHVSLSDAVEIRLPVYRYSTPEVVATAGVFEADGQRLEAVVLPPRYDPTQGELTVQVDPSLAAGMRDGLKFLEHYPYECTEQTVSRYLPNAVTYRAFKELGLERPDLADRLPELVNEGLQRLYNQQHYDGGWGWWVQDESNPYITAYVLLGLLEAQRAGFVVDEGVAERAGKYLRGSLAQPRDLEQNWQANRQAFILYVLAEAGEGDLGRTVSLFEQRKVLDTFGEAYLAMALALLEPDSPARVNTLLSDITSAAIVSATGAHWEEARPDYYAMNTDTRSTAIVLAALARLDAGNALAPNAVRWLMAVRQEGYWETTQESAWAIMALTDWMRATGELEGAYNWHVAVNGELLGEGSVTGENVDQAIRLQIEVARLLSDEANRVVIERWAPAGEKAGSGRLYYGLYLRYYKPVEEVTALNRGIVVSRQYCRPTGNEQMADDRSRRCEELDEVRVGDVVQVRLTVIVPHDLHYVVVEDPFPAGAEGVDQSLKTTPVGTPAGVAGQPPEFIRTDQYDPWGGSYGWWWFSHTELRDEKAVLFATYLPAGTYEYTYLIRASLPGEYRVIPTHAYEMYFPDVFGRSDGGLFTITE